MKRTSLHRKTPLTSRVRPITTPRRVLRADCVSRAINPSTGRVVSVLGAKKLAWTAFAAFIRKRDPSCITCGKKTTEAGHFRHTTDKANKQLGGNLIWYNEKNVHGQCSVCNQHHSGRLDVYAHQLEEKYGYGILRELQLLYMTPKKWTISELLDVAKKYREL